MSEKNNKKQLIFIFVTVFVYLLGFGIIIPITPILSRDLGASATEAGLLMSIYSLMQFLFSPFWGRLSDRIGRRPVLLFCMCCEGFCYLLFAFARNLETLFVARALAGFFGASISTASAYISDVTGESERSKGMALIGVAFGLGFVFGPAIGGGLSLWAEQISQEPFFGTTFTAIWVTVLCFVNFFFGYRYLTESLTDTKVAQRKTHRIKNIFQNLKVKTLGPLMFTYFLLSLAMASMEATLVWYVGEKYNWGIQQVSFGFAYIGVMMILTQGFLVRKLLPKLGERYLLPIGLFFFSVGMTGISLSSGLILLTLAITCLAIGNGLSNPSIMGSVSLVTAKENQGTVLGVTQSFSSLGRILGPAMGGLLYSQLSISAPFLVAGLFGFLCLVIILSILKDVPISGKKEAT